MLVYFTCTVHVAYLLSFSAHFGFLIQGKLCFVPPLSGQNSGVNMTCITLYNTKASHHLFALELSVITEKPALYLALFPAQLRVSDEVLCCSCSFYLYFKDRPKYDNFGLLFTLYVDALLISENAYATDRGQDKKIRPEPKDGCLNGERLKVLIPALPLRVMARL